MNRFFKIIAVAFALLFVFAGCNDNSNVVTDLDVTIPPITDEPATEYNPELYTFNVSTDETVSSENETSAPVLHPKVKFTMENGKSFIIELYPEYAPETCENFVNLVSEGFYDGLTFHRVVEDFMAQGGDPEGTGMGGSDKEIHGEFYANGFTQNVISHQRGVVSMARSNAYDSASSQFFICYDDCSRSLDGRYAAFGLVIEGMETVDDFLNVERVYNGDSKPSKPVKPIIIAKAEVI